MTKKINAGKYRQRIIIKNPPSDSSRDSFGRRKGVGSTLATVWAEKQDWAGAETLEKGRETASVLTKFLTRYRSDVTADMTVTHGTVVYEILSVLDFDGTKREIVLHCRRIEE